MEQLLLSDPTLMLACGAALIAAAAIVRQMPSPKRLAARLVPKNGFLSRVKAQAQST